MKTDTTLLVVNASARQNRSITRELTETFIDSFQAHSACKIIERDVAMQPPGFIDEAWIEAAFTPDAQRSDRQRARLAESDLLIEEVTRADIIILGVPMYNYSMPASLKAWFDQIVRVNQTFSFDLVLGDNPITPLLHNKHLVIASSRGEFDFAPGQSRAHLNGLDPALDACSRFLGASPATTTRIIVEYEEFKDDRWQTSKQQAITGIQDTAIQLAKNID